MEWIVTTARSVEEAREMALDQLGVAEEDAEFEVLEEAKPGLFGRFRKEVRVRARVRPVQPRPKAERRRKRSAGSGSGRGPRKKAAEPEATVATTDDGDDRPSDRPAGPDDAARAGGSRRKESDGGPRRRRPRGDRSDRSGGDASGDGTAGNDAPRRRSERATGTAGAKGDQVNEDRGDAGSDRAPDVALADHAEQARAWLEGLLDAFDIDGEVTVTLVDGETAEVRVDGDNLGVLIGPGGATLQAIQTLSRAAVQRSRDVVFEGRVFVEVGGYRQKRKEALERFTRDLVEQVRETGTEKALEPMGSADRKVVHDTVNACEGVRTISVGEEPRRRVVIVPED